ncbi:MAG: cell division protein FtsX [Saccharofermentanales bacterium]|jgi:cell division transport system permease protein|nr:ABC transporter permease [Clostridiaceae bacterium]
MKLTSVFLSLREGFRNLVRHPLVMLASISTIALMLILLGFFTVFSLNARHIMTVAGQQPPIEITMRNGVGDKELADLDRYLANDDDVLEFQRYSPQENFNQFVDNMENSELFADFPIDNIPYTYTVQLVDPSLAESFQTRVAGLAGVRKVSLELAVMSFLSDAIVWVNYATLAAFVVLGLISFFIISNMVRISVFARGEEISIMKYIGATNWYIRVPYIIEGALVGLIGAAVAWGVTMFGYDRLYSTLMAGAKPSDVLTMLPTEQLTIIILMINLVIGVGVGSLGSAASVRRHIQV